METRYTEKLAHLVLVLLTIALIASVCWYFHTVLIYIIVAALIALISRPLFVLLKKIRVGKLHLPDWLCSILSIFTVFGVVIGLVSMLSPLIRGIVSDISAANIENMTQAVSVPLADFNRWVIKTFPQVGRGFKVESVVLQQLQSMFSMSMFSSVIGSLTSIIANIAVALFAIIFISFFFIKNPSIVSNILSALVPDRHEEKLHKSMEEIGSLVSRYFVGLITEVLGVTLINFLGLLLVARMGLYYSAGIAFLTGMLNIIPYIGPLIGGVLGISLSLIIKYACVTSYGLNVGLLPFVLVLLCIFVFAQMVDNYVYQPLIYSNSVKAHPLEIFIVFLIAGQVGGMFGMLAAIPSYTVIRVIAKQFLSDVKAIRMLTSNQ